MTRVGGRAALLSIIQVPIVPKYPPQDLFLTRWSVSALITPHSSNSRWVHHTGVFHHLQTANTCSLLHSGGFQTRVEQVDRYFPIGRPYNCPGHHDWYLLMQLPLQNAVHVSVCWSIVVTINSILPKAGTWTVSCWYAPVGKGEVETSSTGCLAQPDTTWS